VAEIRITRRAVLAALPAGLAAAVIPGKKAKELPRVGEFVRFADPTTETPVVRLTSLSNSNLFPCPANRFVSARDRFLIFSSDRTGVFAPFRLDLRTGMVRQLAETAKLEPRSLCLDETERSLFLLDSGELREISLSSRGARTLAKDVTGFAMGRGPSDLLLVREGRLEDTNGTVIATNVTGPCLLMRPGGEGCLFERKTSGNAEFWYVPMRDSGVSGKKSTLLAQGNISFPFWSPDGGSVLFLRGVPRGDVTFSEIHEVLIGSGSERPVSPTSQFAAFSPNRDASVFVGSSRSKAQPNVVLLLRSAQREMTICEHHASDAASVGPVFAPDSRRVYFESDREGKPALYSVNVELLVEPTQS
jgi:oligogalacturonide lyase